MASKEELLEQLLAGVVATGYGWTGEGPVDLGQAPMHGYVRLDHLGVIEFEAIDEEPLTAYQDPFNRRAPRAVALATPIGGAVLCDVRPDLGFSMQLGGARESVVRLRSDSLLFGLDIGALKELKFSAVSARFDGLGAWAGLRSLKSIPSTDSEGRLTGLTVNVGGSGHPGRQEARHLLPKSLRLSLDEHWAFRETEDRGLVIETALELGLSAQRARPLVEFLEPLLDVQDLLSTLYRGWVPATPGRVIVKHYPLDDPLLWTRLAMYRNPRAIPLPTSRRPLFAAHQLGGVEGVARWIDVCNAYRPAVDAVVAVYREGPESASATLLRLGAAIEQYVAMHARSAKWASKKAASSFELAVAKRVGGPAFAAWSGDPQKWADRFHDLYLSAKHHRPTTGAAQEVEIFARGGRWLLLAALLDRVARTKVPSKGIFTSGRQEGLGKHTRRALGIVAANTAKRGKR